MKSYNSRIPACDVFCGGRPVYTREKIPAKKQKIIKLNRKTREIKDFIYSKHKTITITYI